MKDFRSSLKGLWAVCRPYRWKAFFSIVLGLFSVVVSLCFVWACKRLVDIATGVCDKPLAPYVWLLAGLALLRVAIVAGYSYWNGYFQAHVKNTLRSKTFAHVLNSSWTGKEQFHSADVLNRIQEDNRVMVDLVSSRIPDVVITLGQLAAASIFLLTMTPGLLWMLIALMAVGVVGSRLFYRTQRRINERLRNLDSESQQQIQENLQNRPLVLTMIGVDKVMRRFGLIQDEIMNSSIRKLNYGAVARSFMGLGFIGGYALAFLWGIFGIRDGVITYGMMTAFLQLVGQVQGPVANLAGQIPAFIQALTSEERLAELDALPEFDEFGSDLPSEAPSICFSEVTFAYPGAHSPVIRNFSHEFPAGSLTVIMGPTGQGKSTLVNLAMGLLKPQSGTISFPLSDGSESRLSMSNFMFVPQGNSLLSGTVRENLLLANSDATDEQMRDALHVAAADFIFELPDGLETRCGEKGSGLSEGQAQRIAIARALLHPGTILIMDESTSALDLETEDVFLGRLAANCRGRKTILFISHRECAEAYADSVLNLADLQDVH